MRQLLRNIHVVAAALLPVLVTGSLYLPDTPPPVGHMVRLALLTLAIGLGCLWFPRRGPTAGTRRAVVFSLAISAALAYPMVSGLAGIRRLSWADAVFATFYAVCGSVGLRLVARRPERALEELRSTLNLVMAVMVVTVWVWSWHGYAFGPPGAWRVVAQEMTDPVPLGAARSGDPDIIHVVLDGMGRPAEIERLFGVDLGPELSTLAASGVSVRADAVANYPQTFLSLASMLNMRELQPLADVVGESSHRGPLIYLIQHGAVIRSLKSRGYFFRFIGSSYSAGTSHALADECDCDAMPFGELEGGLLAITPARSLRYNGWLYTEHRSEIRTAFERLEALQPGSRSQFVLAHVLAPHPPFVIGPTGDLSDPPQPYGLLDGSHYEGTRDHYRRGYGQQARYALGEVGRIFSVLRARWAAASRPLVLIVHGDHGSGMNYDIGDIRRTDVSERLTILLGVSWPGIPADRIPVVRSPVNIYRAVFSQYFGATLPPLPDRSYMTTFEHPYKLVLVQPNSTGAAGLPASGRTSGGE
jgi:hypothetical protein